MDAKRRKVDVVSTFAAEFLRRNVSSRWNEAFTTAIGHEFHQQTLQRLAENSRDGTISKQEHFDALFQHLVTDDISYVLVGAVLRECFLRSLAVANRQGFDADPWSHGDGLAKHAIQTKRAETLQWLIGCITESASTLVSSASCTGKTSLKQLLQRNQEELGIQVVELIGVENPLTLLDIFPSEYIEQLPHAGGLVECLAQLARAKRGSSSFVLYVIDDIQRWYGPAKKDPAESPNFINTHFAQFMRAITLDAPAEFRVLAFSARIFDSGTACTDSPFEFTTRLGFYGVHGGIHARESEVLEFVENWQACNRLRYHFAKEEVPAIVAVLRAWLDGDIGLISRACASFSKDFSYVPQGELKAALLEHYLLEHYSVILSERRKSIRLAQLSATEQGLLVSLSLYLSISIEAADRSDWLRLARLGCVCITEQDTAIFPHPFMRWSVVSSLFARPRRPIRQLFTSAMELLTLSLPLIDIAAAHQSHAKRKYGQNEYTNEALWQNLIFAALIAATPKGFLISPEVPKKATKVARRGFIDFQITSAQEFDLQLEICIVPCFSNKQFLAEIVTHHRRFSSGAYRPRAGQLWSLVAIAEDIDPSGKGVRVFNVAEQCPQLAELDNLVLWDVANKQLWWTTGKMWKVVPLHTQPFILQNDVVRFQCLAGDMVVTSW